MVRIKLAASARRGALASFASFTRLASLSPAGASTPPDWLNCPDIAEIDLRAAPDRGIDTVRALAPSAGAKTSADLSAQSLLSMLSYEMYDAFDRGEDPMALLPDDLRAVAALYGDPGRDTEHRARQRRDTRTFYGFVADQKSTGRRIIVIRGTLQPNEWVRNIQARQAPYPVGERRFKAKAWAHKGFLSIFASLTAEQDSGGVSLSDALPGLVSGRDVTVIGHSLGGALATLVGVEAARLSPVDAPRMRLVTFGSPRVGDPGFAQMASALGRIDRVCNLSDIVTAVPPNGIRVTYTHVGEAFRVSSFDWPALDNNLERSKQVLCWHSIYSYRYIADPEKAVWRDLEHCLVSSP